VSGWRHSSLSAGYGNHITLLMIHRNGCTMYSPTGQLQDVTSMHGFTTVLSQHPVISSCWGGQNKIRTKYKILSHILNIIPANTLQAAAAATNIFDSFRKYKSGIMCKNWKSIIQPYQIFLSLVSVNKAKNAMTYTSICKQQFIWKIHPPPATEHRLQAPQRLPGIFGDGIQSLAHAGNWT